MLQVISIAVFVLAFCVVLGVLGQRLRGKHLRSAGVVRVLIGGALIAVYVYGILAHTVLGRTAQAQRMAQPELLWSYRAALALDELGITVTSATMLSEILLNILLFVPLGILLPFVAPTAFHSDHVARDMLRVALVACAISCSIEFAQLLFRLGLFELDDILNNTFGAVLGLLAYRLLFAIVHKLRKW